VLDVWDMATEPQSDQAVLARMGQRFEEVILNNPGQWLNLYHRRPGPPSA